MQVQTNENQQQEKIAQKARPHVSVFDEAKRQPNIPNIKESHSNQSNLQRMSNRQTISTQTSHPFFQEKLKIGQPNDKYEQEADRIAGRVLQMNNPSKMGNVNATLLHNSKYISNRRGRSLPRNIRNYFEARFGYDFSSVRVHTDSTANKSAQSLHSLAYTVGQDIFFNANQYEPQTAHGRVILAHELVHVIQQTRNKRGRTLNIAQDTVPRLKIHHMIQRVGLLWWLLSLTGCGTNTTAIRNDPPLGPIGLRGTGHSSTEDRIGGFVERHIVAPAQDSIEVREQLGQGSNIRKTGAFARWPRSFRHTAEREWTHRDQDYPDYCALPIAGLVRIADTYSGEDDVSSTYSFNQLNIYRSVGSRGSGEEMPNSGFRIIFELRRRPGGELQLITSKEPEACTVMSETPTRLLRTDRGRGGLPPQTVYIERNPEDARCTTEDISRNICTTRIQRYVSPERGVEELAPIRHERRFYGVEPPLRHYDDATLYGPDHQPMPEHVEQHHISDCWLMAALMSLASTDGGRRHIVSHIRPNHEISEHQSSTYTVTLYDIFDGTRRHYRMEPVFPASSARVRPRAVYFEGGDLDGGILWVAFYERAMAHHRHSYRNLETPGIRATTAFRSITGHWGTEIWEINSGNVDQVYDEIIVGFRSDQAIVISTRQSLAEDAPFSSRHAYSVIELREDSGTTSIRVANPHGQGTEVSTPELPVSREDLARYFNYVAIGERLFEPEGPRPSGCGDQCVAPHPSSTGRILLRLIPALL